MKAAIKAGHAIVLREEPEAAVSEPVLETATLARAKGRR